MKLKRDYGNPDSGGGIDAYTESGNARKEEFLRDAAKYLRAIGKELAKSGLTEQDVMRPNRGGIAVSGEVYGEFRAPGEDIGVSVEMSSTCIMNLSGRRDGATIRAVWRCRRRERAHTPEGPNRWVNPNGTAAGAAAEIIGILQEGRRQMWREAKDREAVAIDSVTA